MANIFRIEDTLLYYVHNRQLARQGASTFDANARIVLCTIAWRSQFDYLSTDTAMYVVQK